MTESEEPVRIVLTPEQREMVHRMSGQHVEAIELEQDDTDADADNAKGAAAAPRKGGPLKFRWRLSAASGIPRQAWMADDSEPPSPKGDAS